MFGFRPTMPRKTVTAADARTAPAPYVFISHDSRDAKLAALFSDLVRAVTANMIRCFRSSDSQGTEGIAFRDEWYGKVVDAPDAAGLSRAGPAVGRAARTRVNPDTAAAARSR